MGWETGQGRQQRNLLLLAVAQALNGANTAVFVATGSLIGAAIGPGPDYATMPFSVLVVGMAAGTLPSGALARRWGRRASFAFGTGSGVLAGLLAALALLVGSFALYCCAAFLGGVYGAVAQSYRFAATDGAADAQRGRAVAWVLVGGMFSGLLGPQLVTWTMGLWLPELFLPSYLAQAAIALIAMAILQATDLPRPDAAAVAGGRPLREIITQRRFVAAALCGVVAYTLMNLVMTSAPLAMRLCGLQVSDSNQAIQWHVLAMFAPSFVTGRLIARHGAGRIVAVGLAITLVSALVGRSGTSVAHFWGALILLGLGWNFAFIGASTLVLETHRPEEHTRVQAFNDFLIFATMACGSFLSGGLLAHWGWEGVNAVVFPPVLLGGLLLAASGMLRRGVRLA